LMADCTESLLYCPLPPRAVLEDPMGLAEKVLKSDESIEWVTVMDGEGKSLAHIQSPSHKPGAKVDDETIGRLGTVDSVTLGGFSRAEAWYGKMDYALLAHERALVVLVKDRVRGLLYAVKTQRSQNAEYLFAKVKASLKG
jgi:hypothetical protein